MNKRTMLLAEETCGTKMSKKYWTTGASNVNRIFVDQKGYALSVRHFFMSVFLPQGYPNSVSDDYLPYQLWDSIQAFASGITGSLSTQAILKAVGVGDSTATPMAASLTWLLKDGTGMIGRILFTWAEGSRLDCDCKKWRLFADIINDVALFMDLLSPYFINYVTPIACISGLCKSVVGVAGGATRAAITQHQALKNNMADVAAKDGSQETLINLSSLICSLMIIPVVSENHMMIWSLFFIFTAIHLFANYIAVSSVIMDVFNMTRFKIVMDDCLRSGSESINSNSVYEVNKKESPFLTLWPEGIPINLGISLETILKRYEDFEVLKTIYDGANYLLDITSHSKGRISIDIILHDNSIPETNLEAMFQACVLHHVFNNKCHSEYATNQFYMQLSTLQNMAQRGIFQNRETILKASRKLTLDYFPDFLKNVQLGGWITHCTVFGENEWKAVW